MPKSYYVSSLCVGCGACRSVCPAHCISCVRPPMVIDAAVCTGCGRCAAACPRRAILICGEEASS